MICTFCGHRADVKLSATELSSAIELAIQQYGITQFYCGYHGAFDRACISAVDNLLDRYSHVSSYIVTPYHNDMTAQSLTQHYTHCSTVYPFENNVPARYAIIHANRYMVDNSHILICYIDYSFGGAYNTYIYAMRHGNIVINLGSLQHDNSH